MKKQKSRPFYTTKEEVDTLLEKKVNNLVSSDQYALAFSDREFLTRDELRPVRLQLELMKPELALLDNKIEKTIVVFGSARTKSPEQSKILVETAEQALAQDPENTKLQRELKRAQNIYDNSQYLKQAHRFAELVTKETADDFMIVTGGGPGFMEAATKGAHDAGGRSVGLGVILPHEQVPNMYVTPELTFQFHYFAIRKMHFLMRAQALVAFPGGFGTFDELFETLTLLQTQKIERIPLLLFNKRFWQSVFDFDALVDEGTINESDLDLFQYVETAEEAWDIIKKFYQL